MLALRAEVYPDQEIREISIGEFSLRLTDELANNKVDGDIVRTRGASNISCLNCAGETIIFLAFPQQSLLCLQNFYFYFQLFVFFILSIATHSFLHQGRRLQ
jgi:hypothetical protein